MGISDLNLTQIKSIDLLMRHGWTLDKIYGDGPVSMSKTIHGRADGEPFAEPVMVFVDTYGDVHRPRTCGTMAACSELYELGIKELQ